MITAQSKQDKPVGFAFIGSARDDAADKGSNIGAGKHRMSRKSVTSKTSQKFS